MSSQKGTCLRIGGASLLALTFSTFALDSQAADRQPAYQNYNPSAAYGSGSYETTTVRGMLQARQAFRGRPRARTAAAPQISDYGPNSQELDRRRHRLNLAGPTSPGTAPRSSRDRMSSHDRWLWDFHDSGNRSLGNNSNVPPPAALAAPPSVFPAPIIGGANNAAADGGGALRGAGAPTNVDSPTEGYNGRFRDEADAQSSKPPLHPGSPNPNR